MNALSNFTAQPSAVAPAIVAARTNALSADHMGIGGRAIKVTLAGALRDCITKGIAPNASSDSPAAEVIWSCKRMLAGDLSFAPAERLRRLVSTASDSEESKLIRSIVDLLSRPEAPVLLPAFTVEILTLVPERAMRGLARYGQLHPRRESGGRSYYDATALEGVLRRQYNGNLSVNGRDRILLLERKCVVDGHTANLLGLNTEQMRQHVEAGQIPSIRVGMATVLLRTDVLSAAVAGNRNSSLTIHTPIREANRAA